MPTAAAHLNFATFLFLLVLSSPAALACNQFDRAALLSFRRHLSPLSTSLNWTTSSSDCCRWQGVSCSTTLTVAVLSLPALGLAGTLPPSLLNLSSLILLDLSGNRFSGPLPPNPFPSSLQTLDLSGNLFSSSIDPASLFTPTLVSLNVSNNSFSGAVPSLSSICAASPLLHALDFSRNKFSGDLPHGIGGCANLQVFRAGYNSLSGLIPRDLYSVKTLKEISLPNNRFSGGIDGSISFLSNLAVLELQFNALTGEIPPLIGLLSKLEQLQLHTNGLNGSLPPSLMNCTNLTTLLLRNNHFTGDISALDFSNLSRLQSIDLGNNSFVGTIPDSLCYCRSLIAVRLAYNRLVGEVPPCMASLRSLEHMSLSDNYLSNAVGALKVFRNCRNLSVLFLSRCFSDEPMPDDDDLLHLSGFENLQILTLGGCQLEGKIPSWIGKLRKLKVLNLSYNRISGPIPAWLGDMPSLFVLNLTKNYLTGELPREIGSLPALISDNMTSDLSYLALPFLFDSLQYNRLFNLPRGVKVGYNSLNGSIPPEIGQLKLLHLLDLNNNSFTGSIPQELSRLVNLERLDLSGNHLSGAIPGSLASLHFLSSFSVANNDLEGEIPKGGQFETFPASAFEGNPKLCGYVQRPDCSVVTWAPSIPEEESGSWWRNLPFGMGYLIGFFAVALTMVFHSWRRESGNRIVNSGDTQTRSRSLMYNTNR